MRPSVPVSSSCRFRKFWFAFRSGYASLTANSDFRAPLSMFSACACSPTPCAFTAMFRAWVTASRVSRSWLA